jgi:Phosphate-selective porin O and P
MKRYPQVVLFFALFLAPASSYAISVPLGSQDATLNLNLQLQPQFIVNEAGTPDGMNPSYDLFIRRVRIALNGNVGKNFSYYFQLDDPNYGKFGNLAGRVIVQDAWVGWAPTGIDGGTVVYVDAGLLYTPISRHVLGYTTNFITADLQTDGFRLPGSSFPAFRDLGVQVRGWALDKKIGFRGGVYEGYAPIDQAAGTCAIGGAGCITPKRHPAVGGFVNLDLIGSEEGLWLYSAYKWGTSPILSVSVAGNYQSLALKNAFGNLTDQRLLATGLYLDLPMTEQAELVVDATLYVNRNGSGSPNTGTGFAAAVGYRYAFIAPYVAYDYFQSSSCDAGALTASELTLCNASVDTANSRNLKAGVNLFFNKNLNHLNLEFGNNHGLSAYGPSSITAATAGYVPTSLDPLTTAGPRRVFTNSLANQAFKSLLVQWTVYP